MTTPAHVHPADLHGAALLAADATGAVTDIVEAMHDAIAWPSFLSSLKPLAEVFPVAGLAYSGVRGGARLVGGVVDVAMTPLAAMLGEKVSTPQRDTLLSVLGGVIGDHLADTQNPLAIRMQLRRRGRVLVLRRGEIHASLPRASARIAVLIHGLCGTDGQWKRADADYGAMLEREHGFTPLYLRYNSGRHISTNGRELAALLDRLVAEWPVPVEELLLVGHSMGGLVARSAVHHAAGSRRRWTASLRRIAFLGAPHHGAPLERGGHWFETVLGSLPYAAPLSRLGRLRSAGITDLRHGNLLDADWHGRDRFAHAEDHRVPVALPPGVDCLTVAATAGARPGDARDRLLGDGLVPLASALGHHEDPRRELEFERSRRIVVHRAGHMSLLGHREVHDHLSRWLEG